MSFGFAARNKKAVMRGPMVSSIVNQLVFQTNWGELDYLVVDMPPGTGDIQITLCQELKFDGAVIVTTPQKLSVVDVIKGVEMFDDLKVPTIATVENMVFLLFFLFNSDFFSLESFHLRKMQGTTLSVRQRLPSSSEGPIRNQKLMADPNLSRNI